jgi:CAAX protease family protein
MSGAVRENPLMDEPAENRPGNSHDGPAGRPEPSSAPEARPAFAQYTQTIFISPEGLRPVWRVLAYFGMRELLYLLLVAAIPYFLSPDILPIWLIALGEAIFLVAALIPGFLLAALESRSFGDYGLPRRSAFGQSFWVGAIWGFAGITLLLLALYAIGDFDFGHRVLQGARILKFAVFWGFFFLLVGVGEEFFLRGYAQFTLSQSIGFWPAAIVFSIGFGVLHANNPGENTIGLAGAAMIGLFFCLTLRRTGNLWFAVGFHAAWDWGESYFYSVPDSGGTVPRHLMRTAFHGSRWLTGGSVGPEGSVLVFVVIAVLWIMFDRVYREVKYRVAGSTGAV